MHKYRININGHIYEMEVERIEVNAEKTIPMGNVQVVPPLNSKPKNLVNGGIITAPIPGQIMKIACTVGEAVEAGQVLAVIEAMKMENEIIANKDGIVRSIYIKEGQTVGNGEILIEIE